MSTSKIDTRSFDSNFKKIVKNTIPTLVEKGMGKAGIQLLNDCILEAPTVPLDEGWLRGSGSVFVQGNFIMDSPYGQPGRASKTDSTQRRLSKLEGFEVTVGFNTAYAARLHESIGFIFKEPSSGPKFLETKMQKNRLRYMNIVANTTKAGN